jgi:hypothetical protein
LFPYPQKSNQLAFFKWQSNRLNPNQINRKARKFINLPDFLAALAQSFVFRPGAIVEF